MASSDCPSDDSDVQLTKWKFDYFKETNELKCGWCGELLFIDRGQMQCNFLSFESHFENCNNNRKEMLISTSHSESRLNKNEDSNSSIVDDNELLNEIKEWAMQKEIANRAKKRKYSELNNIIDDSANLDN